MNERKLNILIIAVVGIIITAEIIVVNIPFLKVRLYSGDRITGTLNMTVNDITYNPSEEFFEFYSDGTQKLNESDGHFTIKGGEYGAYHIGFYIENNVIADITKDAVFYDLPESTPLIYTYFNANWWHITELELDADLVKENDEWILKVKAEYTEQQEDGSAPVKHIREESFDYIEASNSGDISIYFGL